MTPAELEQLRAAWQAATSAMTHLRALLVAAGVDVVDAVDAPELAPATESTVESPADRRRRLAAERTRRWRAARDAERVTVTPEASRDSVTVTVEASPASVTVTQEASRRDGVERHGDGRSVTVTHPSGVAPARAFLIEEDLNTSPLFATQTAPPAAAQRHDVTVADSVTPPDRRPVLELVPPPAELPVADAAAAVAPAPRRARQPAARRAGATNGTADGSIPDPAAVRAAASKGGDLPAGDAGLVWQAYVDAVAPTRVRLTPTRAALIARRLRDYTAAELVRALRGYGRSTWHRGDNDRGRPYQSLELWLRDAAHVEAGWQLESAPERAPKKPKTGPALFVGIDDEWQQLENDRARAAAERDIFAELGLGNEGSEHE